MRWTKRLGENIKRGIRSWLQIQPSNPYTIQIQETMDFELSAIRNRIWYWGDGNALEQMYQQNQEYADKYKFWASKCTQGMEMRKIHTGLPGLIIRVLCGIVMADMVDLKVEKPSHQQMWDKIDEKTKFRKKLKKALKETLFIGDGAWKVVIDTRKNPCPTVCWYSGDRVEYVYDEDDLQEVVFKSLYKANCKQYILYEHYGYGYVHYELYLGEKEVPLSELEKTRHLSNIQFDDTVLLAVPMMVYESVKFEGRGGSLFDGKLDSFDAFDETWSQWMDALRAGRAKTYIPESLIPKNSETGEILKPNPFDNRYIKTDSDMGEGAKNQIDTEQPSIPHDSYLASYVTALDLCLQGIISPSTLGIDMKKLDNAEAQREKEKTTLYTRNAIVETLQEVIPEVMEATIHAYQILLKQPVEKVKAEVSFGEYANPSFESQVETLAKARPGVPMMSIEAQVEELYGDSKDKAWKQEEVDRLKAEQGIAEVNEPGVNTAAGEFKINMQGGKAYAGKSNEPNISNEPARVSGITASGQ